MLELAVFRQYRHQKTHTAQPDVATGRLTIGNVGDLTKDVVSADLFVALWWAHQCLADHGDVDFSTNAAVSGLRAGGKCERKLKTANTSFADLVKVGLHLRFLLNDISF